MSDRPESSSDVPEGSSTLDRGWLDDDRAYEERGHEEPWVESDWVEGDWPDDWTEEDWPEEEWVDEEWVEGEWPDEAADEVWADDGVKVPRRASRARRILWVVGGGVALLVLVVGVAGIWLQRQIDPPGEPGASVEMEIPEGATVSEVAGDLEEAGVVSSAMVFRFYAQRQGLDEVQAGRYEGLRENSAMGEVVSVLEGGPSAPPPAAQVTVPEGLRLSEVTQRLTNQLPEFDAAELAAALGRLESTYFQWRPPELAGTEQALEGFLFPDTYRIEEGDQADELKLVQQMVQRFERVADELGYPDAPARVGLNPYELLIVASIVEREAKADEDFAKVSRVIHNRLAQGMPLEVDATLLYEIGHTETLTQSQLETDSPYNTRLNPGLPPSPIAMPGRQALEAAMNPEEGPWLYYVLAEEDGGHFFTDDYDEFLRVAQESRDKGLFE